MNDWWYARDGKPVGPYNLNALQEKFRLGEITLQTLFWREGLAGWVAVAEEPELSGALVSTQKNASVPPPLQAVREPALQPQHQHAAVVQPRAVQSEPYVQADELISAGNIRRFLARSLDIGISGTLVIIALVVVSTIIRLVISSIHIPTPKIGIATVMLASMLFLPATLVVDALIYGIFGNTLGKALLGIRVLAESDERLGFGAYLGRNFQIWLLAFGLGLPLVNLLTLAFQAFNASSGNPATYDAGAGRQVVVRETGAAAKLLFGMLYLGMLLTAVVLLAIQAYAKHVSARQSNAGAIQPAGQVQVPVANPVIDPARLMANNTNTQIAPAQTYDGHWTNPMTGRALTFIRAWEYSNSVDAEGVSSWSFSSPAHRTRIAIQYLPGSPAEIANLQMGEVGRKALETLRASYPEYSFANEGSVSNLAGHPSWAIRGVASTQGFQQEIEIQYIKANGRVWGIMIWKPQTGDAFSVECEKLYTSIMTTII